VSNEGKTASADGKNGSQPDAPGAQNPPCNDSSIASGALSKNNGNGE
jgi:hypothetical protein